MQRREFLKTCLAAGAGTALEAMGRAENRPDYLLDIAPYTLDLGHHRSVKTIAYNGQVPGPLLRLREGRRVTIEVRNRTDRPEVVHWHGLFLPPEIDGALEEGTPPIPPGGSARYTFTPRPAGFRWYHTHTFAGRDLKRAQYTGQHGFLLIEPRENPARYDQEVFLGLHDWNGYLTGGDDGFMNPMYLQSTINGKMMGAGDPLRVRAGERVLMHLLNTSATDPHWIALAGHSFEVIALDGNPVPHPQRVAMLRLSPAERVDAIVTMDNPGVWTLGEVRKHIQAAGMGMVVEYANRGGAPQWRQPDALFWNYLPFGDTVDGEDGGGDGEAIPIPLTIRSRFNGHGDLDHWTINGQSFPHTESPTLRQGERYRLLFQNQSDDDHPLHLHRHIFELRRFPGAETRGILKDTVLVGARTEVEVEFTANNPGATLFHCHQQDHMDMGLMMLFRYV